MAGTHPSKVNRRKMPSVFSFIDEDEKCKVRPPVEVDVSISSVVNMNELDSGQKDIRSSQVSRDGSLGSSKLEPSLSSSAVEDNARPSSWCTRVRHYKKKISSASKEALQMSAHDQQLLDKLLHKAERERTTEDLKISTEFGLNETETTMESIINRSMRVRGAYAAGKVASLEKRHEQVQEANRGVDEEVQYTRKAEQNYKQARSEKEGSSHMQKKSKELAARRVKEDEKKKSQEESLQSQELARQLSRDLVQLESMRNSRLSKSPSLMGDSDAWTKRNKHDMALNDAEQKQLRAQEIFRSHLEKKELQKLHSRLRSEERKAMQEERVHKRDEDLKEWRAELEAYQKAREERADLGAKVAIASKSWKARQQRAEREADHALMKSRVEELNEMQMKQLESLVTLKQERAHMISSERRNLVEESREAARASRALRDRLKEQMIRSSFDRMAEEAERVARIERMGNKSTKKNSSNVSFG